MVSREPTGDHPRDPYYVYCHSLEMLCRSQACPKPERLLITLSSLRVETAFVDVFQMTSLQNWKSRARIQRELSIIISL